MDMNAHQGKGNSDTTAHPRTPELFVCDRCGKSFKAKKSLTSHYRAEHLGVTHPCSKCGRSFKYNSDKLYHERTCKGSARSSESTFKCGQCTKEYASKQYLDAHVRAIHSNVTYSCDACGKHFAYKSSRDGHKKNCVGHVDNFVCPICARRCSTAHGLRRHQLVHSNPTKPIKTKDMDAVSATGSSVTSAPTTKRSRTSVTSPTPAKRSRKNPECFRCRRCTEHFDNRRDLYLHGMSQHFQTGSGSQPVPWGNDPAPWENRDGEIDGRLRDVYEANAPLILQEHQTGPIFSSYNFPIGNDVTIQRLMRLADEVYQSQGHAYKLNLVFGVILQNRETGEYRYFRPYNNNAVMDAPIYMSKRTDQRRLYLRLRKLDITTDLLRQRPDTKWIPVLVTNVRFTVFHTHYPLGNGPLPQHVIDNPSIHELTRDFNTLKFYTDNLCAFRCLALHQGHDVRSLEGPTKVLFERWTKESKNKFQGVSLDEFPRFEEVFQTNLEVYKLDESGHALSVYKSRGRYEKNMYLNMYENHLSYIKDFAAYAKKYRCRSCDRHFNRAWNLHRHQRICTGKTEYVYPGGFFKPNLTVFEKLRDYGIKVSEKTFPWFVVFDFESMLVKAEVPNSERLVWTQKHEPISVSVCSNVPGYTDPHCIVDPDLDVLVGEMVEYMLDIAGKVETLAKERWASVEKELQKKMNEVTEEEDEDSEEVETKDRALLRLYGQLQGYMSQVPVLGFNTARYDLNLIKQKLARHLNMHAEKGTFVVKRNNEYTCISSPRLKFLDIMQFLAPGTSLAKFLKAYGVEEGKGFFPYEWLTCVDKLDHTSLPPHEAFFSSLKNANIGIEEYEYCQRIWRERNMVTFRDFLIWYNDQDVGPFVTAVERLQRFYFDKGIDVLKTAISVPGIARQMLFKTAENAGAHFSLFDKNNVDLYETFKNNIVGGPSIIFTRRHVVGTTRIRGGKPCKKILGFDANALYLWAIDQRMPVGAFVRRRAANDFKPELRDRFMAAYHWMGWLNHKGMANIQHRLNRGVEKRIGKYPVDGWDPETNTVYQFHGCYWHGHQCESTRDVKNEKWLKERDQKLEKTGEISQYIRKRGHVLVEMWECDFRRYCKRHPKIYGYINSTRPGYFQKHRGKVTAQDILTGIRRGGLFGAVEVEIEVPDEWPSDFRRSLTPHDYFAEMSPLFCTSDVPHEEIGAHMQDHVERFGLSKTPRRLLVGGMKARQILLATPLLKWYLDHGMRVTRIHQVVEYQSQACFRDFVTEVSDARRAGDARPEMSIIADTMKLQGNSAYGSLIMDKTKHREIKYLQGENDACLKVNDPRFRKLECLEPEHQYYEVEMAKKKIKLDLPIQLGYFILQYAKLRMLEFYYDFMDEYVQRSDFEYTEMDTDSAYLAISGSGLDDVIRPEMRERYEEGLRGFCTDEKVEADADRHWFPRSCCEKHAVFDRRTPGLFKTEFEGDEMIGLCSKTYIVLKKTTVRTSSARIAAHRSLRRAKKLRPKRLAVRTIPRREVKYSSKGISKRNVKAPLSIFRRVMKTQVAGSGINRGFRAKDNTIFTYVQERRGFGYFYCKRRVLADGVHTEPLDLTLCPIVDKEDDHVTDEELAYVLASEFED